MAARAESNEKTAVTLETKTTARGQVKVAATDPEYTLSVVGLVTALVGQPIVGLVISAIALKQSKRADRYNLFALLGFIFGIIFTALYVLFIMIYAAFFFVSFAHGGMRG